MGVGRGAIRLYVIHQRSGAGARGRREVPWNGVNARRHCQMLLPHPAGIASAKVALRSDVMPLRCAPVSDRLPSASALSAWCHQVPSAEKSARNRDCSPMTCNACRMGMGSNCCASELTLGLHVTVHVKAAMTMHQRQSDFIELATNLDITCIVPY